MSINLAALSVALLLGVLGGIYWDRWWRTRRNTQAFERLNHRYFKGLNYLLNDESDKAIDVFIQLAETSHQTFEPQLALGNLYRRKGEVDRAIKLHQALIAQADLPDKYRSRALLAMGKDYMSAGLLDRAEVLFSELVEIEQHTPEALFALTDIYQQEQDWLEAIRSAKRYQNTAKIPMHGAIAHYYCELADLALAQEDVDSAKQQLETALATDEKCVRAILKKAEMNLAEHDFETAKQLYQQAIKVDNGYLPLFVDDLAACYLKLDQGQALEQDFLELIKDYHGVSPVLTLANWYERKKGADFAEQFVEQQLQKRASVRGLKLLLELKLKQNNPDAAQEKTYFELLRDLVEQLLNNKPKLRCRKCGFGAQQTHWQCPSCKHWGVVKPIYGLESE